MGFTRGGHATAADGSCVRQQKDGLLVVRFDLQASLSIETRVEHRRRIVDDGHVDCNGCFLDSVSNSRSPGPVRFIPLRSISGLDETHSLYALQFHLAYR